MRLRRRKIKPVPGTRYGIRRTRHEDIVYERRNTTTRIAVIDAGGFVHREEVSTECWDFVAAQPRGDK